MSQTSQASPTTDEWRQTACILCSVNCGIEVKLEDGHITKVRGDRAHPGSRGYACEKAQRLDHYQNGRHRLATPLRRKPDGTFEPIDWDTAIREVAAKLVAIRDAHGGASIFYYGGGGQGNHLPGGLHVVRADEDVGCDRLVQILLKGVGRHVLERRRHLHPRPEQVLRLSRRRGRVRRARVPEIDAGGGVHQDLSC